MEKGDPFELILLEAVDDGLAVLGESVKLAIYFHVEKEYSVEREEIPQKIRDFSCAIRKIFGPGSRVIENIILQKLCEKLNQNYEVVKNKDLLVVVEELKIAAKQTLGFEHDFRKSSNGNSRAGRSY